LPDQGQSSTDGVALRLNILKFQIENDKFINPLTRDVKVTIGRA
jgi:hypothetical protein